MEILPFHVPGAPAQLILIPPLQTLLRRLKTKSADAVLAADGLAFGAFPENILTSPKVASLPSFTIRCS
jgi:hypothetical protein